MFTLHVSRDFGVSYHKERESETLYELRVHMAELDKKMLRWYVTNDGDVLLGEVCGIHKGILDFTEEASDEAS